MTTEEGNKLIAQFLNWKSDFIDTPNYKDVVFEPDENHIAWDGAGCYYDYEMQFNKSWDWLMPVIKKIEHLEISLFNDSIHFQIQRHLLLTLPINTDILTVYSQVVDFIKWYNDAK